MVTVFNIIELYGTDAPQVGLSLPRVVIPTLVSLIVSLSGLVGLKMIEKNTNYIIESIKMRFKNRKNDQDDLTIDLTPLLDVSFIILIFFILTTTFIEEKRLAIEKPKSNSVQTGQNTEIKIAIDKNNSLYFKNKLIDPGSLREKLENELQNTPMSSLVIEADKTSELSIFVLVVDTAKSLDIQDITISTDRN